MGNKKLEPSGLIVGTMPSATTPKQSLRVKSFNTEPQPDLMDLVKEKAESYSGNKHKAHQEYCPDEKTCFLTYGESSTIDFVQGAKYYKELTKKQK